MSQQEIPFNIGFKLGEISQKAEICLEFAKNSRRERPSLKVAIVYESLRYIAKELEFLSLSIDLLEEIKEYLNEISGGKFSEESSIVEEKTDEMILGRIKKSLLKRNQNLNRNMKNEEMKTFLHKLHIWRDRISNSFART